MGGSISAGGGIINDYSDLSGIYYRVFMDWWQNAVQPLTGSNIGLRNLAVGGTASNFFSFCYKTLMEPEDNLDIVFLEFSVNDCMLFKDTRLPRAMSLERLTRQLLSEDTLPAVMFVNFIQGQNYVPVCNNLENNGQTMLAWHYGITSFSTQDTLCPNKGMKKYPVMFSSDDVGRGKVTRDVVIVFRTSGHGGKAEIWLEKNKPGIVVNTYSPFGHTKLVTVAHNVTSGSHVLTVRVVKAGEFLLCGIMTGQKSMP
ncbi:hypothetical protein ACROYT_G039165 [Oculina patagonica]